MIKLTEKQKQVTKLYLGCEPEECDQLDDCTKLANALLNHEMFDLIQNAHLAHSEAKRLLGRFGLEELEQFVESDEEDENAWLMPGANEHEFYAAKEAFIKEIGL